ncbi:hypothetical protein V500_10253 [Pseudogymnoascus sp. VKM F-4518 (FW-2643)]|nr:hypothetical protein V500_10253 [Pseudogymnoascus sp. VKM F-4518 (FW-2643)]
MRGIVTCLAWALSITSAYAAPPAGAGRDKCAVTEFSQQTIFVPPRDYNTPKTLYGRTAQLEDGTLLATWENYSPEPPIVHYPIYKSTDKGKTWAPFSTVKDVVNGWGLRYQPFLYVLPRSIGEFKKGTVLCAGNSLPTDLSKTKIDIYASRDDGKTWSFVSSVASGGRGIPNNGETPIWEPFLMVYKKEFIAYYADQRDPDHGQKLSHQVSSDLVNWGPIIDDASSATYDNRPGMTTVARLRNGEYLMLYEFGGGYNPANSGWFPVYYKIAADPRKFDEAKEMVINAGGVVPTGSPYVVWSPSGGRNGTIVVSAASHSEVFVNTKAGDPNAWVMHKTPQESAYTRSLMVMDDPDYLLILGAGQLNGDNKVTDTVMRLPNL